MNKLFWDNKNGGYFISEQSALINQNYAIEIRQLAFIIAPRAERENHRLTFG